jgi:hypothetical protein
VANGGVAVTADVRDQGVIANSGVEIARHDVCEGEITERIVLITIYVSSERPTTMSVVEVASRIVPERINADRVIMVAIYVV